MDTSPKTTVCGATIVVEAAAVNWPETVPSISNTWFLAVASAWTITSCQTPALKAGVSLRELSHDENETPSSSKETLDTGTEPAIRSQEAISAAVFAPWFGRT